MLAHLFNQLDSDFAVLSVANPAPDYRRTDERAFSKDKTDLSDTITAQRRLRLCTLASVTFHIQIGDEETKKERTSVEPSLFVSGTRASYSRL